MADTENYNTLQEFTEDASGRGNKPILYTSQGSQGGVMKGMECLKGQISVFIFIALLASVCVNIVLGVLLTNSQSRGSSSPCSVEVSTVSLKLSSVQERYSRLCSDYTALGKSCSRPVRKCQPCPEGWTHLEGKCYYYSDNKLNWEHSKENCASMGSYLAILHTHEQHDALANLARSFGGYDYHYWIGLSDTEVEGVWKWVDNTLVNKTYWNEWEKEPNNHQSGGEHGEDCAVLESHSKSWFDVPCDFLYKRICETDAISTD